MSIVGQSVAGAGRRQPPLGRLNGLITNDKFCLTRYAQLQLSWSRHAGYLDEKARRESVYPADKYAHLGGTDETPVANPPHLDDPCQRSAALGSSLPQPSAMDVSDATRSDRASADPQPGGVSCE